jgi:predicted amidophosphoribosyltransferase
MKCPKCAFDNKPGKKFCIECGAKLILVCPQCGSEIEGTEKFCGECGQSLEQDVGET